MAEQASKSDIVEHMQRLIATQLRVNTSEVDPRLLFARMGLDSVVVLSLCKELGKWLDIEVKPQMAWDYPTIEKMAEELATKRTSAQSTAKS